MKIFLISLCLLLASCAGGVRVDTSKAPATGGIGLAAEDVRTLLTQALDTEKGKGSYEVVFLLDSTLSDGNFAVREAGRNRFELRGGDAACLTHAAYSLLEQIGYTFDVTGVSAPGRFDLEVLRGFDKTFTPAVRWRGIRQHVNFPMDISSYPIEEAKEYLKNLLRMRFNKLAVHSYPGQWYEWPVGDTVEYAGHFFYGDRHYFYDSPLLREKVRFNDSTFCIPAAEPLYDNAPRRSTLAVAWMRSLIATAKDLGMMVQFSVEPRNFSVEESVRLAHQVVDTYPDIDALELITTETGGWGGPYNEGAVRKLIAENFPPEALRDTIVLNAFQSTKTDLDELYGQIARITRTLKALEGDEAFCKKMPVRKMGIYCTMSSCGPAAYRLARLALPDYNIAIMPSHGARRVANEFDRVIRSAEDLAKTEIYSWIEFDGLMYIQQNPVSGIATLERKMDSLGRGLCPSLLFNHWRTAENRTAFRYGAVSTLGKISPEAFYLDYAARLGIPDAPAFARAMQELDRVEDFVTENLFNVAFCWMGAWSGEHSPFNYVNTEKVPVALEGYLRVGEMIEGLFARTDSPAGREYLSFLGNRTSASVVYLKAFEEVGKLKPLWRQREGSLTQAQREYAVETCNHALLVFEQFLDLYARQLPDRGCEGTLVSVWNSPVRGLKLLRSRLGGIPLEELPQSSKPVDAPPLPMLLDGK